MTKEELAQELAVLTPHYLERAHIYHGNLGAMRVRFVNDEKAHTVEASTYTKWCFEKAEDVETKIFPWDESGVAALRQWLAEEFARRALWEQAL